MDDQKLILSEIRNLKEFFEKGFADNKEEHREIRQDMLNASLEREKKMLAIEEKIRILEDWKLVFVTKYTVYSAIALFLGSIVSTIGYQIISKYI